MQSLDAPLVLGVSVAGVPCSGAPAPAARMHRRGLDVLLLVGGTLAIGFSGGRWFAPAAAWLGPALLLRFARRHPLKWSAAPLFAASLAATVINWWGIFPIEILAPFWLLFGLLGVIPYLVDRALAPRLGLGTLSASLVFPAVATAIEWANTLLNPAGNWGSVGYSQYGNLPLMQLASLTGVAGITFVVTWTAGVANGVIDGDAQRRPRLLGSWLATLFAVLLFGATRVAAAPSLPTVRLAGVTAVSSRPILQHWAGLTPEAA